MGMTIEQLMRDKEYRKDIDKKFIKRLHDDTLAGNLPWVMDPYFDYEEDSYRVDCSITLKNTDDDFSNYIRVSFGCYSENEFDVELWDAIEPGLCLFEDGYTVYSTSWQINTDDPEVDKMIREIYEYLLEGRASNVFYTLMASYATGKLPLSRVGEYKCISKRNTMSIKEEP